MEDIIYDIESENFVLSKLFNLIVGMVVGFGIDGWVLVYILNVIGMVCGYMWDDVDVEVFCC